MANEPNGPGSRPVPDPTVLTTAQLLREIGAVRENFESKLLAQGAVFEGQKNVFEARLYAADQAIKLLQSNLDQRPHETDVKVSTLEKLHDERFHTVDVRISSVESGIEKQFEERDVRVKESAATQTTAVNAALQAAKEQNGEQYKSLTLSIDKSEKSTFEQINQQRILLQTNYAALNDKIVTLDTRLTRFEGLGLGTVAAQQTQREVQGVRQGTGHLILGIIGLAAAILFGVLGYLLRR